MRLSVSNTPAANLWRAFFVLAVTLAGPTLACAQGKSFRPQPDYVQLGKPDQQEGRRVLEEFRQLGLTSDYYFEFQLRVMPRRGNERLLRGQLWSTRNEQGALTRVTLRDDADREYRLLVQNGSAPAIWSWQPGMVAPGKLGGAEQFAALAGTDLTPFDLQMPFLYWSEFAYEGLAPVRGRPAHRFLLYPPAGLTSAYPSLTAVRVSLDSQYRALVDTELLGPGGKVLKTTSLVSLRKTQEQWIPKSFDLRDETTHNKTRLTVIGAALGLDFPRVLFAPGALGDDIRPPSADRIERFESKGFFGP